MDITQAIPWIISGLMLLFSILTYSRNGREKNEAVKESLLKANMKLDQVCATTNETRTDIKSLNKDMTDINTRISVLENGLKAALDDIKELKEEKK